MSTRVSDGYQEVQASHCWHEVQADQRLRRDHQVRARKVTDRAVEEDGWSEPSWTDHYSSTGWWRKASLSPDRFQARQVWGPWPGCRDRVRSEPVGKYRTDPLPRW